MTFFVEEGTGSLPVAVDFNDYSGPLFINEVLAFEGGGVSAIFLGQQVDTQTGSTGSSTWAYNTLSVPAASGPNLTLTFIPPDASGEQNLAAFDLNPSGPPNYIVGGVADTAPDAPAGLAGAISVQFDVDQREFGMDYFGRDQKPDGTWVDSTIWFDFMGRFGTHLGRVAYEIPDGVASGSLHLIATGGGFSGVTITNNDWFGLGYDDFRFRVPSPTPASLLLAGAVLMRLRRSLGPGAGQLTVPG